MAIAAKPTQSPAYLSSLPDEITLSEEKLSAIRELEWAFDISTERLTLIVEQFLKEFKLGLSGDPTLSNGLMIPTYIHDVPNGTERGVFLALDLGGTNLRVCEVTLNGDHTFDIRAQKYRVSDQLKTGPAESLFDYIAQSVDDFLSELGTSIPPEEELYLGFTFSFPVLQTALDKGTLITWTKGFRAFGAQGHDVVELLQDALDRKHIHVRCSALVNDTVGCLMARAYQSGDALVGAIFGTGTNGAYVEKISSIPRLRASSNFPKMVINTEWGAFDNKRVVLPITIWDNKLDRESINPRKQAFEKMISGMYLGEVTRNAILHLIDLSVLFSGHSTPILNGHYGLDTATMSRIESLAPLPGDRCSQDQVTARLERTKNILLEELGLTPELITHQDCVLVQRVCEVVATRAARLSATALAAIAKQTGYDGDHDRPIVVGVDGSVVEHYPHFETRLRRALSEVSGSALENRVKIGLAKDGSGVGAALCALQAKKQRIALESYY